MSTGNRIGLAALILTLAVGVLVTGPWFYTQLLVWKEEGHDHMLLVADIMVTIGLWAVLIFGIWWNFHDARRAVSIESRLLNIDYECKIKIEKADREHEKHLEGLRWMQDKTLESTQARLNEAHRIEVQGLREEITERLRLLLQAKADRDALKSEIDALRFRCERTPYLTIEYFKDGVDSKLRFTNQSGEIATETEVGPLAWQGQSVKIYVRPLVPPLSPNAGSAECSMYLDDSDYGNDLRGLMAHRTPENAETTVGVIFKNRNGDQFLQNFILTSTAHGSGGVTWQPTPPTPVAVMAALQ